MELLLDVAALPGPMLIALYKDLVPVPILIIHPEASEVAPVAPVAEPVPMDIEPGAVVLEKLLDPVPMFNGPVV